MLSVLNIIMFLSFLLFIDVVSSCAEKYLDKYRTLSKFNDDLGPALAAIYWLFQIRKSNFEVLMDYWICSRNVHFIACYFNKFINKSTLMQLTGHIILKIKQIILLGTEFTKRSARYTFSPKDY